MDWLTQNWIYLLLLAGVIVFMRFGMGCGMAGRRAHPHPMPDARTGSGNRVESARASEERGEQGHRHHRGGCY